MIAIASPNRLMGGRAEARNIEIERCLKMSPEFIFMMDDDQTMPNRSLNALTRAMFDGYDLAVIDAPNKGKNDSNIYFHPNGELAHCTISCCLIRSSIFSKLAKPWFFSKYAYIEDGKKDGRIVWRVQEKVNDDNRGEDIYFVRKVIEGGFKIMVVKELKSEHFEL